MKVLNFIWGYGPGGVDKCFLSYAKCDLMVVGLRVISVCVFIEKKGVDIDELKRLGVKIFRAKTKYDLSWVHEFNMFVDAQNFDLAFLHASQNTAVFLFARMMGLHRWIPIVRSRHGEFSEYKLRRTMKSRFLSFSERFFLRIVARRIVAVSQAIKEDMIEHGIPSNKITVIYNGVSDNQGIGKIPSPMLKIPKNTVKFVAVARLVQLKGIDSLMAGFAKSADANPEIHLIIVGDGPERESLQSFANELRLDSRITFVGNQTNVVDWLSNSDVYCLTSYSEAFPIGLLEAMRAGLPCIVSHAGGIPEAVTDDEALFVKAGDVECIASAIKKMASDAEFRARLGASARKRFLSNFTEDKMIREIADWLSGNGGVGV